MHSPEHVKHISNKRRGVNIRIPISSIPVDLIDS